MSSYVETYFAKIHVSEQPATADEAVRKDYVDNQVSTSIANLVNSAPEALNTLKEISDALNNDANLAVTLTNQINSESAARALEDGRLSGRINDANAQISKAKTDINSEVQNRVSAVNAEVARATAKENVLQGLIDTERSRALAAESGLSSRLDTEEQKRDDLNTLLSEERIRAIAKETELQGLIEAEVSTRDNAIIAIQSSLDDNVNTLTTSINSEIDLRASQMTSVNNALNSAVSTLNSSISGENTRAFDAENALDAAKLDKSESYFKDYNGYFRVASSAYLMIGDRWRISCNSGDSEQRRLVFEYKTDVNDDNSFVVGVPFIQSL